MAASLFAIVLIMSIGSGVTKSGAPVDALPCEVPSHGREEVILLSAISVELQRG